MRSSSILNDHYNHVRPVMHITALCPPALIIAYARCCNSRVRTWRIITNLTNIFASLARHATWLKHQWVMEVPEDLALCEFDCRRQQCLFEEWACCQRRMSNASGELLPAVVRIR
jgi:hypothetical protein